MKSILEPGPAGMQPVSNEMKVWLIGVADAITRKCGDQQPHVWAYRSGGHEYLACDYSDFALTFMFDSKPDLRPVEEFENDGDQEITVTDMTDALTIISLIEQRRQAVAKPVCTIVTPEFAGRSAWIEKLTS